MDYRGGSDNRQKFMCPERNIGNKEEWESYGSELIKIYSIGLEGFME